jgi:ribosomal protein S18 acetylase RimI-like enzyme
MEALQFSIDDAFSRDSVFNVLNGSHDRRIRQKTLDFYRNGYPSFLKKNGTIIWLVGIDDVCNKIGISGCAFGCKSKQVIHSFTAVHPEFRRLGYGKKLLSAKLHILRTRHPKAMYRSYVNMKNTASIKMCSGVGLIITDEGKRKRKGKSPTHFYVFEE